MKRSKFKIIDINIDVDPFEELQSTDLGVTKDRILELVQKASTTSAPRIDWDSKFSLLFQKLSTIENLERVEMLAIIEVPDDKEAGIMTRFKTFLKKHHPDKNLSIERKGSKRYYSLSSVH